MSERVGDNGLDSDRSWMYLPPGMKSIDDPELDSLAKKLGFFYKAKEFKKFQEDLAGGVTVEELITQNPLLAVRIKEWREIGLIE